MARKAKRKHRTRPASELLRLAKEIDDLAPGLKRLRRRKTLTPAEKAWITRTANRVQEIGGKSKLLPVTEKQAKKLRKQKLVVGKGIRAVAKNNMGDAKLSIKKGKVTFRAEFMGRKRTFNFVRVQHVEDIPDRMAEIIEAGKEKGERRLVYLMTVHGRGSIGAGSVEGVEREFAHLRTAGQYEKFNPIVGIVWFNADE